MATELWVCGCKKGGIGVGAALRVCGCGRLGLVLGLVYAVTAGWAQGPDSPGVGTSSPMAEATAGFQAIFRPIGCACATRPNWALCRHSRVYRNEQLIFRFPLVSGLDSATDREHLSDIRYRVHPLEANKQGALYEIVATATSTLWAKREFHWRLYADHLEFDQTAMGEGKLGRCYFFSDGRPGRWDKGLSDGAAWNSTLMADRYWSPSPNHANQWEFSIAEPQTLGFSWMRTKARKKIFAPAQMADLFSPPPLMLAFHRSGEWASIGIGTPPGQYRFPALEYSGSRYAGAAWWVDYLGYQQI